MKRIFSVVAVAALMAAMLAFYAVPAFAAASDDASCKGQNNSSLPPGAKGKAFSTLAKDLGGLGQFLGETLRSCNPNANPRGGGTGGGGV